MIDFMVEHSFYFIMGTVTVGLVFYLLTFIYIVRKVTFFMTTRIDQSIVYALNRHLQHWNETADFFTATLNNLQSIRTGLGSEIDEILQYEVNRMHDALMKSNQIYRDDLERLHIALDDLLIASQALAKNNDIIRKQQKEIQNWQRRAERVESDYKNQ